MGGPPAYDGDAAIFMSNLGGTLYALQTVRTGAAEPR